MKVRKATRKAGPFSIAKPIDKKFCGASGGPRSNSSTSDRRLRSKLLRTARLAYDVLRGAGRGASRTERGRRGLRRVREGHPPRSREGRDRPGPQGGSPSRQAADDHQAFARGEAAIPGGSQQAGDRPEDWHQQGFGPRPPRRRSNLSVQFCPFRGVTPCLPRGYPRMHVATTQTRSRTDRGAPARGRPLAPSRLSLPGRDRLATRSRPVATRDVVAGPMPSKTTPAVDQVRDLQIPLRRRRRRGCSAS